MPGRLPDPQLAAVRRLSKKGKWAPLVREVADAAVELILVERGRLKRYHVDTGGSAMQLETVDQSRGWLVGNALMVVGVATLLVPFVARALRGHDIGALWLAPVGVGLVVTWIADGVKKRSLALLRREHFPGAGWSHLYSLELPEDKPPLNLVSIAQLLVIEHLAEQNGQHAAVRARDGQVIEVVTNGRQGLERHVVSRNGTVAVLDGAASSQQRALKTLTGKARAAYGGGRGEWVDVDLRPSD